MTKKIFLLLLIASSFAYGQTKAKKTAPKKPAACDFIFEADTSLQGKTFLLSSYLNDGCDVYTSTEMRSIFATLLQTKIPVTKEYFKEKLKKICIIDKCILDKVGIYKMSVPGEVMLIITYR